MATIFIDGAAGTTGLRIHERLSAQPDITLLQLPEARRKELPARLAAIAEADLSILCLPDDASVEIAAAAPAVARIIDASTAHRTRDGWVYGFPELSRRATIAAAPRVTVPGCHATGFLALATPLIEKGALDASIPLTCYSLTGYSGGGKQMIAAYEDENRPASYSAPRLYALTMAHKHLPEMKAIARLAHPPLFCPVVADFYSGLLVSIPLPASALSPQYSKNAPQKLAALYRQYYQNEPLITAHPAMAVPSEGTLAANTLTGKDTLEIFTLGNEEQLLLAARLDNLGKGACGAAIQCMNLMLHRPETAGLLL